MIDIYKELGEYGIRPIVVDPAADADEAKRLYGIDFHDIKEIENMDAVVIAVAHSEFLELSREEIGAFFNPAHKVKVLMDIKGLLDKEDYREDYLYWRL